METLSSQLCRLYPVCGKPAGKVSGSPFGESLLFFFFFDYIENCFLNFNCPRFTSGSVSETELFNHRVCLTKDFSV